MKKILIADDEPHLLNLLKIILQDEYTLIECMDGLQVLDSVKRIKPDLILLDLMMPKKNGYEVCKELKANKDTKGIPVIIVSAKDKESDVVVAKNFGADDYLKKPFDLEELENKVRSRIL